MEICCHGCRGGMSNKALPAPHPALEGHSLLWRRWEYAVGEHADVLERRTDAQRPHRWGQPSRGAAFVVAGRELAAAGVELGRQRSKPEGCHAPRRLQQLEPKPVVTTTSGWLKVHWRVLTSASRTGAACRPHGDCKREGAENGRTSWRTCPPTEWAHSDGARKNEISEFDFIVQATACKDYLFKWENHWPLCLPDRKGPHNELQAI